MLCNLVTNAVEHGGGQAEVVWRQEGAMVALDVLDRGPGLPDGHVERVFERFHKVDSSRTRRGAGLGLAIALEHARAQGGSLEAANREGGGARFTFRLPLSDPHGSESGPEAPASSPVSAPRS
ncbi:MAG TPA: sensor histidine kinase [Acidimicrobiales bacterium]|nr:sensor histidine kinase [Acidimicrobiales bacterium]